MAKLERRTVAEELAERLSRRIYGGDFEAGERLPEIALAAEYDTTRTTVRAALRLLERERVVRLETHRGATVASLEPGDLHDILAMRLVVEPEAVRILATRGAPLPEIYDHVDELERSAEVRDWIAYGESDIAFHCALVERVGSARLTSCFERAVNQLKLWMRIADEAVADAERPPAHVKDHRAILEHVTRGHGELAARRMRAHLRDSARNLSGAQRRHGPPPGRAPREEDRMITDQTESNET